MLLPPPRPRCVECGLPYGAPGFQYWHGDIDDGAAYWCDRGLLCSPACSRAHYERRRAEGTLPERPVGDPAERLPGNR